jgi:epothilone polyketide synthase D
MKSLKPAEGLQVLSALLHGSEAVVGVVPLDLRQWGAFHQTAFASARFSVLRSAAEAEGGRREGDRALLAKLREAPAEARSAMLTEHLRGQVAHVLRIPSAELDASAPLTSLGLDSLMGLELRNHIESALGLRVPATLLWTYPTLSALCEHMAGAIFPPPADGAPTSGTAVAQGAETEQAAEPLGDRELIALLDDELALARKHGA